VVQPLVEHEPAACSVLGYVEVRAALVRAGFKDRPRRLTAAGYDRAVEQFERDWPNYLRMPVTEELLQAASNLARVHLLRAYDAFHLATLIALKDLVPDIVTVSTWDPALALAAEAEGFSLAHEVIT
jgi:hypothetical protein